MQPQYLPSTSAFYPQQSKASDAQITASLNAALKTSQHQSSSPRTPKSLGHLTIQQQAKGLRFPSSRRFLWDATPAGPQVLIDFEDHAPRVQIAASVFSTIARAAEQQRPDVVLQLSLSVTPTNQVAALVQELDPLGAQTSTDCLRLTCPLSSDANEACDFGRLQGALAAQLDQRDTARVQQLYAFSAAAAAPGAIPVDRCSLQLHLLMPLCSLLATPLYTKRLCNVPLAEALLKPGKLHIPQTGYLSMDQARSLLPLEATDVNVYSTPLVGVWVKGPNSVVHPLVAAACLRFAYSSLLADRAVNSENGAFLLLLCPQGDPVSKCFEVRPTQLQQLQLSLYQLQASISRSAGLAQFSNGGFVTADWVLSSQQPQPMPEHLKTMLTRPAAAVTSHNVPMHAATGQAAATQALALPGTGSAVAAADSPIVLGRAGFGSKAGPIPAARNSAPMVNTGSNGFNQQQFTRAAARRSLPLSGVGAIPVGAGTGFDATEVGHDAANSKASGHGSYSRKGASSAEPEPRAGFCARPYGSPPLKSWPAASQPPAAPTQQQAQQHNEGQEEQQQWVQLGEQLLAETTATEARQGLPDLNPIQPTAAVNSSSDTWSHYQQQQRRMSPEGAAMVPVAADSGAVAAAVGGAADVNSPEQTSAAAAAASSPQLRIKTGQHAADPVQQHHHMIVASYLAADAGLSGRTAQPFGGKDARHDRHFQVHSTIPVSPSVQAGVALSHLALLQHLSTGKLEQAVQEVASPGKARSSPAKAAAAASANRPGGGNAADCGAVTWGSVTRTVSNCCNSQRAAAAPALEPGTDATTWSGLKPQTPDTERGSLVGSSVLMGSPGFGPAIHHVLPSTSVDVCREAAAGSEHWNPLESASGTTAGANAAAALRAATAAVHRLSPGPVPRGLGVQQYAADTAVISSQDHGQVGWSGWTAAAGGVPGLAALGTAGGTDQLEDALYQSLTAAVSSAAALEAAGNLMHPYNAPDAGLCHEQTMMQRQQLLGTMWHDPVAQALQGEVQRLREELLQLRHQLMSAGMPRLEALALQALDDPPASGPPAALPAPPAPQHEPHRQQAGHYLQLSDTQQRHQQGSAAVSCPADQATGQHRAAESVAADEHDERTGSATQPSDVPEQGIGNSVPCVSESTAVAAANAAPQSQLASTCETGTTLNGESAPKRSGDITAALSCSCAEVLTQQQQQQQQQPGLGQEQEGRLTAPTAEGGHQPSKQETYQQRQQQQSIAEEPEQIMLPASSVQPSQQLGNSCSSAASTSGNRDFGAGNSSTTPAVEAAGALLRNEQAAAAAASPTSVSNKANDNSSSPGCPAASSSPVKLITGTPAPAMGFTATHVPAAATSQASWLLKSSASSSAGGARGFGGVRASLEVPPLVEVVRTKYCALDDDSDDSDREFEERLMLKYGMKH